MIRLVIQKNIFENVVITDHLKGEEVVNPNFLLIYLKTVQKCNEVHTIYINEGVIPFAMLTCELTRDWMVIYLRRKCPTTAPLQLSFLPFHL